jgi:hypothetical protein
VNNGLIFLLYAQPPVWRACPTLDKIVAAHDLSMFVGPIKPSRKWHMFS